MSLSTDDRATRTAILHPLGGIDSSNLVKGFGQTLRSHTRLFRKALRTKLLSHQLALMGTAALSERREPADEPRPLSFCCERPFSPRSDKLFTLPRPT